ncbi:ABC transporter substrate-binding protein [Ectopseudomonas mendocina]|uniref:ABC transporter substrate-binding protein n=1 Tax=Ectopseudomonas mendocina TaxID=300 RepID=A0ABZ2RMD6_ECTME
MRLVRYCLIYLGCLSASVQAAETIQLFIPDAPPLTFQQHQLGYGIAGDMTLAAIGRAGMTANLINSPWARAQITVSAGRDQLITPLSRTPEREEDYTWIAPIMALERAFFSLGTPVSSFEDARKRYNRIAVGHGTPQEETLLQAGISREQIVSLKLGEIPITMLKRGRVDAWFTGVPEALFLWPEGGPKLRRSPVLNSSDIYLACSKDCNPELVQRLRQVIEQLHKEGELKKIMAVYLPER